MSAHGNTNPRYEIASLRPELDLPLGHVIPGSRYRAITLIGRGGMGAVYEAEHVDLRKRVAIKVLLSKSARDTRRVAAFLREAQTASRIESPYIADVTDFGELPDGRVYFVMQYIEGDSLGRLLRAGEEFTPARAIPILRQIAKGLSATHHKGVVHLDVKPDNIMLVRDASRPDSVKMVDFGIAGLLEDARAGTATISGTPEYVSPERIQARGYDVRSDVYSLGVVAYELLTGTVPFRGEDAVATLKQHIELEPAPMATRAPGRQIHPALEKLIRQLLAKDPHARPADMAVVEAMLCDAQIHAGLSTTWDDLELPPVDEAWRRQIAERMPSPAGRRRKIVALVASGAAVVAGGLALYFGVIREPRVIIKEVRVEVTSTQEAEPVAVHVMNASRAMRRQQYVAPIGQSALDHIESAEREAEKLGTESPGARLLRDGAGSALLAMGRELEQVELHDLALIKYREALRFLPDDAELERLAQLLPEEKRAFADREAWQRRMASNGVRPEQYRVQLLAAEIFQAARKGAESQARLALKELESIDEDGAQRANLADGLRKIANAAWGAGKRGEAQTVYKVIAGLDPADRRAAKRAEEPVEPGADEPVAAPVVAEKPEAQAPTESRRRTRRPLPPPAALARDENEAARLVEQGRQLTRVVKLKQALQAFEEALAADPRSHGAYAGLAEVYFEQARYEDAISYARRATDLAPRQVAYKLLLGDCYYKVFRYAQAAETWKAAQRLSPQNVEIANRLKDLETKRRR